MKPTSLVETLEPSDGNLARTLAVTHHARTASFWESARIALDSLNKSKLRSFLTLLGIILATTTLIVVVSFVNGMNLYIANKLSDMGSDGFRVVRIAFIGNWDPKKYIEMERRNPQIHPAEWEFIRDHAHLLERHRAWKTSRNGGHHFVQGRDDAAGGIGRNHCRDSRHQQY